MAISHVRDALSDETNADKTRDHQLPFVSAAGHKRVLHPGTSRFEFLNQSSPPALFEPK
ncbi:MAG: hypothetical protein MKZ95_04270 [Pirellulales bacterium]|nr:hypothetical protein [Pirellulales bacterium]